VRTWILCVDDLCAKILTKKTKDDGASLCRTIRNSKRFKVSKSGKIFSHFASYVAEEIEIACGAGTETYLILCAENKVLQELLKHFSTQVKQAIVGTVEKNLCQLTPSVVEDYVADRCPV